MQTLTIFYDAQCGLCTHFRRWLLTQQTFVELDFIPYYSPQAKERFPNILQLQPDREIIVLADDGRWWQGPQAWLTCLWALKDYRKWSFKLAHPNLLPLVGKLCLLLSENRVRASALLRLKPEEIQETAKALTAPCTDDRCLAPSKQKPSLNEQLKNP